MSWGQSESSVRSQEIEDILDKMETNLQIISDSAKSCLREVGSERSSPSTTSIPSRAVYQKPVSAEGFSGRLSRQRAPTRAKQVYSGQTMREQNMEATLRNIAVEITLEYFNNMGSQRVSFIDEATGNQISKLTYPLEGPMPIFKGELRFLPRVSLGGKYANSQLKDRVSSDEDWDLWSSSAGEYIDYQITKQAGTSRVEFFDINLYYNLFASGEDNPDQKTIFPAGDPIYKNLNIDRVSLDVLAGYQYYKGRYRTMDPMYEAHGFDDGSMWYDPTYPKDIGLDSFYKIKYWGPRIGLRLGGSKGRFSSQLRLALSLLHTKAYGWWNLRDYSFWESGKNGYGTELGFDTAFAFTPSFSAGLGFNYFGYFQQKMDESGNQAGVTYYDADIVRSADCRNYGPSLILKYIW